MCAFMHVYGGYLRFAQIEIKIVTIQWTAGRYIMVELRGRFDPFEGSC